MKKITILLLISIYCTTIVAQVNKLKVKVDNFSPSPDDKIVLCINALDNIKQPTLPLIDAAELDIRLDKLSNDLIVRLKEKVKLFDDKLTNIISLKTNNRIKIQYLDQNIEDTLISNECLNLTNEYYPELILSPNSKMTFPIKNGNFSGYFSNPQKYSNRAIYLCENQKSDFILNIVTCIKLSKPNSNACNSRLISELYILNKEGQLVYRSVAETKKTGIRIYAMKSRRESSINTIANQLNQYENMIGELVGKINWQQ